MHGISPRLIPLMLLASSVALAAPPVRMDATFRQDPSRAGFGVQGADDGRFAWIRGSRLAVALDSNADAARFIAPLGMTLDGATSFRMTVDFTLVSISASPDDFFQLSFGACNMTSTGLNRTGTALAGPPFFVDDSDVFDAVSFDYFPNVTFFGGPFLQPAVFGAARGSAFANFAANFGPSADLGDNGAGEITELPAARALRVVMDHDACRQQLVTRIFDISGRAPVELATGLEPLDLRVLNATGTFTVDAFAIHAYRDLADFDPSTPSLEAALDFHQVLVERLDAPAARVLPRAVQVAASAPARVAITGVLGADGAVVRVVRAAGAPADVVLDARAHGGGLVAEIPRALAAVPLVLDVGGCEVAVDGPARTP